MSQNDKMIETEEQKIRNNKRRCNKASLTPSKKSVLTVPQLVIFTFSSS